MHAVLRIIATPGGCRGESPALRLQCGRGLHTRLLERRRQLSGGGASLLLF
jgi:hypothetical protein